MPLSNTFAHFSALLRHLQRSHWTPRTPRMLTMLASVATVSLCTPTAWADNLDNHDALVQQYIQQQHATPLVADCAAHAAFVVPTSPVYERVAFLSNALDSEHTTLEPWGKAFDNRKQRISVDNVVTVTGLGFRKDSNRLQPDLLNFRCGYVADKLLAFGYDEAETGGSPAQAEPIVRRSAHATRSRAGHHAVSRGRHANHASASGKRASHTSTKHTASATHKPKSSAKKR